VQPERATVAVWPFTNFFLLNEAIADLIQPGLHNTGELREAARKLGWAFRLREMGLGSRFSRGLIPIFRTRALDSLD